MSTPFVTIDSYRSTVINDNRSFRSYNRSESDIENPVIVEFYNVNGSLQSIDPLVANAIPLKKAIGQYTEGIKRTNSYSHYVIFVKIGDATATKYLIPIHKEKSLDSVVKRLIENNIKILRCIEVPEYYGDGTEEIKPAELVASLDIVSTKDSILYNDDPFPVRCDITYTSGYDDWFAYKYTWNLTGEDNEEVIIPPNGTNYITVECTVEFRLIDQPMNSDVAQFETVAVQFSLSNPDNPIPITAEVDIVATDKDFLVDKEYTFRAVVYNLGGGYKEWNLREVKWNVEGEQPSTYELVFKPTESKKYYVECEVIYEYKKNKNQTQSFKGVFVFESAWPMIQGNLTLRAIKRTWPVNLGDVWRFEAVVSDLENDEYWHLDKFEWSNVDTIDDDTKYATCVIQDYERRKVRCIAIYVLNADPTISRSISGMYEIVP